MKKLTIYQYLLVIFIIVIISSSGSSGIIITFVITELLNLVSKQLFLCAKIVQIRSYFWSVFSRIRTEYGEISVFSQNAGKYEPEKTPSLDTFHAVFVFCNTTCFVSECHTAKNKHYIFNLGQHNSCNTLHSKPINSIF